MQTLPDTRTVPQDKRQRTQELFLVLSIAFLGGLIASFFVLLTGASFEPEQVRYGSAGIVVAIGAALTSLALVQYVLSRQGRGWRQIGLSFAWKDIGWSLLLFLTAALASWLWRWPLYYVAYWLTGHVPHTQPANVAFLRRPQTGFALAALIVYSLINPFREELIVRAYLMSEAQALTGKVSVAVFASVGLQVCYHFYQGPWPALSSTTMFLVFALYYARTRRILPVVLAHLYFDVLAVSYR